MHLFLTSVLPFLAHNHASAAAFLTCCSHNFHASIIPEFLSSAERVERFCEARQQNQLESKVEKQYKNLFYLFVQTPLMQFSPSLVLHQEDCAESILKPLLETKYFTRTLQRCSLCAGVEVTNDLLQGLSKVQSLTKLDLAGLQNQHLEIIVNSCPSLETLNIGTAASLDPTTFPVSISSPPPAATKTLRSVTMCYVSGLFAAQFASNFTYLRKIKLIADRSHQELDLLSLTSSLPHLTDLSLEGYDVRNIESLNNLVNLSALHFYWCKSLELNFLDYDNSLPELTTLRIDSCHGLSASSFASLTNAPNLHVLEISSSEFNNDCLQYLENMIHLRKLDLNCIKKAGDSHLLKSLMQSLCKLEELQLNSFRDIGNQGAIAGALYSTTHSRLRVLKIVDCQLVDDDLNGIDALKDTLEVLDLSYNGELTTESLVQCKDLVKLKNLRLYSCGGIDDLTALKYCPNLEELYVGWCEGLTADSFKIFSEEPNSFPNLRVLDLSYNKKLTEQVFEHLAKNNNLVYQLKELNLHRITVSKILASSPTALNNLCQFKGLQRLYGIASDRRDIDSKEKVSELKAELVRRLKNLEEIS